MDATLFKSFLETNTINFIIMISILVLIFKKAHLGDVIDKMAEDIRNNVDKSATSTKEAIDEYKETKKISKDTPKLQEAILDGAQVSAKNLKEKIEHKAICQEKELIDSLKKIYQNQGDKIKKATTKEIYLACVEMAQEEVVKRLDENTHKKIINKSIDEIDRVEGSLS